MVKCGIVGLPNVGKSTLFNALVARKLSPTAAYPFTTIQPHEAVVPLPDEKLQKLADLIKPEKVVPAAVTFVDIAGLVKGANEGLGLGNQFLAKIREVDAILHVVRKFPDPNVPHPHGQINPKEDIEVVNLELEVAGIEKPMIYVVNSDEKKSTDTKDITSLVGDAPVIAICAKLEEELLDLAPQERLQYLKELGTLKSGLEKLITEVYRILGLITFYTIKGGKEVHAWSLKQESNVLDAAAKVHTDFAKNFIRAEVINCDELLVFGSWTKAKEAGKVRTEGKDYIVQDGDVIEFLISS